MARVSVLSKLNPDLRAQLHQRLLAANFGHLEEIALWLNKLGVTIGKSALGEYALRNEADIRDQRKLGEIVGDRKQHAAAELRLRCAEAAARVCGDNPSRILPAARAILGWVLVQTESPVAARRRQIAIELPAPGAKTARRAAKPAARRAAKPTSRQP